MKYLIKNVSNGIESEMTEKQWSKVKADPRYIGTFALVKEIDTPKEIKELDAKKEEAAAPAKADKKPQDNTTQDKTK